jgi:hypothetical protein
MQIRHNLKQASRRLARWIGREWQPPDENWLTRKLEYYFFQKLTYFFRFKISTTALLANIRARMKRAAIFWSELWLPAPSRLAIDAACSVSLRRESREDPQVPASQSRLTMRFPVCFFCLAALVALSACSGQQAIGVLPPVASVETGAPGDAAPRQSPASRAATAVLTSIAIERVTGEKQNPAGSIGGAREAAE